MSNTARQSKDSNARMDGMRTFAAARTIADKSDQISANDEYFNERLSNVEEHVGVKRAREISRLRHQSAFERVKGAALMALEHRKSIEQGDFSVFLPAFVFAIAKDGFLDMIPLLGQVFGFPIAVYLFIFCWGKGTWKLRIVVGILSLLDFIPAVNLIPMSTMCIFYVYHGARKNAAAAKKELMALEKSM